MKSPVLSARLRLAVLWLTVLARAVGENAVRTYALLQASDGLRERSLWFVFLWLGLAAAPAFALAPLIGSLASSRGRWAMMVLATLVGLGAIAWSSVEEYRVGNTFWLGCIAVLAFEASFFGACRFSVVPEAVRSARLTLPRAIGMFTIATASGIGVGIWIGITQFAQGKPGLPVPLQFGLIGYGLALVGVLLARFPTARPIPVNDGLVRPFLKASRAIFRTRNGRNSLLALWGLFAIGLAVNQWLYPPQEQRLFFLVLSIGLAFGCVHWHSYRTLGLVPYAAVGLAFSALSAYVVDDWFRPALAMTLFMGIMVPPLLTAYTIHQPDDSRGHGGALLHAGWSMVTGAFLFFLMLYAADPPASRPILAQAIFGLCLIGLIFAWLVFFRPAFELTVEVAVWPMYRINAIGPSALELPWRGPLLVIANHASWFDPLWLAKVLPCPVTPMMTSKFYDKRVISWLVRRVTVAIRVPDVAIRKEAPELMEAIAALDRGECVVLFPEGWLQRKDNQELRRFGRGVWQILKARPATPVVACFIDGSWGSMVSYKESPPFKNKKLDLWRPIRIGMLTQPKLDLAFLETHLATRTYLMKEVLEARALLGLPAIDPLQMPVADDDAEKPTDAALKETQ